MEDGQRYSFETLQRCSYRFLQQTAKALCLPSNVKKTLLIQLIHCKKNCSPDQVQSLVKQVRLERQQLAWVRKRAKDKRNHVQQSAEISSTSNSKSPPITTTPKRVSQILIRYSPDLYSPPKRNRSKNTSHTSNTISVSDRVLRSFRALKNPNYVINKAVLGIYRNSPSPDENKKTVNEVKTVDKYQKLNMALLKKQNVEWRNSNVIVKQPLKKNEIITVKQHKSMMNMSPQPVTQQRRLSGIYSLNVESKRINIPKVSVRRADGTVSKLNAYIQKSTQTCEKQDDTQSLINTDTENSTVSTLSVENFSNTVSNMFNITSERSGNYENVPEYSNMSSKENEDYTVYYHKKIRAEQVRSLRTKEQSRYVTSDCRLPAINDAFSKFSNMYERNIMQPIYVQVSNEPRIALNQPLLYPDLCNYPQTILESLYNINNTLIMNQPLGEVVTTTNTYCVYSTPVICTAKAQPSANGASVFNNALPPDSYQSCMDDQRMHNVFSNYHCDEVSGTTIGLRRRSSSRDSETSQDLGANVTIPEMVEDALEIISQDGDYMERMGMDIRMQCMLCEWAGPKILLEYHIRKEHSEALVERSAGTWQVRYSLGALCAGRGAARLLAARPALLVLRATYRDPDCFCASLKIISSDDDSPITGSITAYNKLTGEPFTWKGIIEQLPPTPSYDDTDCLRLELSKLDVLPNSANLKLLNRELVANSPAKVVVGQPELDNIFITLNVKLFD